MRSPKFNLDKYSLPNLGKRKYTLQEIADETQRAKNRWNVWAGKQHREDRERYEQKFDALFERAKTPYEREQGLKDLCFHEEKATFEEGAKLWSEMIQWIEYSDKTGANKLMIDISLNEEEHWEKIIMGSHSPIHHEHSPAKGTTFIPPNFNPPLAKRMVREMEQVGEFKVTDNRSTADPHTGIVGAA